MIVLDIGWPNNFISDLFEGGLVWFFVCFHLSDTHDEYTRNKIKATGML